MASRLSSHLVNAPKWHASSRRAVAAAAAAASSSSSSSSSHTQDASHLSAFDPSSERCARASGGPIHSRRYFGYQSKCGSSQYASKSPSSLREEINWRSVENHHGSSSSSQVRRRLACGSLLPVRNYSSSIARKMEGQEHKTQRRSDYRQLAPLQGPVAGDPKEDARGIVLSAIEAVTPNEMIVKAIQVEDGMLVVQGKSYHLRRNVYVAAFGKAVLGMIRAVEDVVGEHVVRGVASVPFGIRETLISHNLEHLIPGRDSKVEIFEGAKYNLPDQDCVDASKKICELADSLSHGDILLVLISGGGSALFTLPQPPITLDEVIQVTKALGAEGATITQLNMMRRHLSLVKGGRFAQMAAPAQVVSLILSDVLGDPLEAIASGPTVPCITTAQCCLDVLATFKLDKKRGDLKETVDKIVEFLEGKKLKDQLADSMSHLNLGSRFRNVLDEKMGNFSHVQNVIVGTNKMVVEEAISRAESSGYRTLCVATMLDGIARERGVDLANMALYACSLMGRQGGNVPNKKLVRLELDLVAKGLSKEMEPKLSVHLSRVAGAASNSGGGMCLISAGETTVQLSGSGGKGGRNQEMALAAGIALHQLTYGNVVLNNFDVLILSVGTDGQDGPTDAAGAFADVHLLNSSGFTVEQAQQFLDNNDSYNFFKQAAGGAYHIITGLTGTNVMDLQLILIKPKGSSWGPSSFLGNERTRKEFDQTFE